MLLDRKNRYATTLRLTILTATIMSKTIETFEFIVCLFVGWFFFIIRKMYVFKIIPLLNPDGVYNGHYRSDVMGHNLNRVYLTPKRETQPSIYAVRKLIRLVQI